MKAQRDLERLRGFYGAVASDQNRAILQWVTGRTVLELGCGYGTFVDQARERGKEAFGLDIDLEPLDLGKKIHFSLGGRLIQGDMGRLPFKGKSFQTVILRESLHHVRWEGIFPEILRVCRGEIIIFEPNPNWVLRLARRIISHKDQEVPMKPLLRLLQELGLTIEGSRYRDLIAFPLSGGFVGREWVPPIRKVYPLILTVDKAFHFLAHLIGVEKMICWRYLVKGVLRESGVPK